VCGSTDCAQLSRNIDTAEPKITGRLLRALRTPGKAQMMLYLDIAVEQLEAAVAWAL
jgi:hypothetical protein